MKQIIKINTLVRLLLVIAILISLTTCDRIFLVGFSKNIPMADGTSWTNFQAVIAPGDEGTWDTNGVRGGAVIKDGATYRMWYVGDDGTNNRIIYADSTDGKTWGNFQPAVDVNIEGNYDTDWVFYPTVIKDGLQYKMWYTGLTAGTMRILYAESTLNPWTWVSHQLVVDIGSEGTYDAGHAWAPTVIKEDGLYKMWYTGTDAGKANDRILYAESDDGKIWNKHQLVIDFGAEGTYDISTLQVPRVIKDAGLYRMWYNGWGKNAEIRILYCDSVDGINWANFELAVDIGAEGTWDTQFCVDPAVVNDNGYGKLWYRGYTGATTRIIYCESF